MFLRAHGTKWQPTLGRLEILSDSPVPVQQYLRLKNREIHVGLSTPPVRFYTALRTIVEFTIPFSTPI
jgi:hypothetical protein